VNEALRDPDIRKRLEGLSAEVVGGTPQATAAYMRGEVERWHNIIKSAGVKIE
jgi:tripartite-type tricarboxylate transporter receptor subunit TctC